MKSPRILISGAGIAGLALARQLEKLGMEHVLLEKRPAAETSSSGIALPFNAIQALRKLDLAEKVLAVAHQVDEVAYTRKDGTVLGRANLHEAPLNADKFVALQRSKLHQVLLEGVGERVHFETSIIAFEQQSDGVNVQCSNPALSGKFDLVVAAEGIHSALRAQCFAGEATTVDYNMPTWRFLVSYPNHGLQPIYMFDRTELFMAYPIGPNELYGYAHLYDDTGRYASGNPRAHLQQIFGSFGGEVNNILARLGGEPIVCGRVESVTKPYYAKGRIVFIGDASHACSPLLQQGAAAAFEDVLCLADQLKGNPVDVAIAEYQKIRAPRTGWVVKTSDAPIKAMKWMRSPLGAFVRDVVVRKKGPLNAVGWRELAKENR